ncbi:hypothetical protein J4G08_01285 [Candidatus Poribacteria bacterium]|nr:hypothetical protein [Candidatus Poribacteria bacterium]
MLVTETANYSADTPKDTIEIPELQLDIHVEISCSDNTTKSLIESYIKRELRSLGDIELVDRKDAKWILSLIVIPHTSKTTGNKTGRTSIAIMRLYQFTCDTAIHEGIIKFVEAYDKVIWKDFGKDCFSKMKEISNDIVRPVYNDPDLALIVNIENNDLHNTCKEIVAEFDVEDLEPRRKNHQQYKEMIEEINKKYQQPVD